MSHDFHMVQTSDIFSAKVSHFCLKVSALKLLLRWLNRTSLSYNTFILLLLFLIPIPSGAESTALYSAKHPNILNICANHPNNILNICANHPNILNFCANSPKSGISVLFERIMRLNKVAQIYPAILPSID